MDIHIHQTIVASLPELRWDEDNPDDSFISFDLVADCHEGHPASTGFMVLPDIKMASKFIVDLVAVVKEWEARTKEASDAGEV